VGKEMAEQGGEVNYGEEVVAVEALKEDDLPAGEVRILRVSSRRVATGEIIHRLTRNVVVSTGGQAKMPPQFTSSPDLLSSNRILHTSAFVKKIDPILSSIVAASSSPSTTSSPSSSSRPIRLAVVGAGQSAAECFLAIRSRLASILPTDLEHRPQIDMLFRASSLRPTDEGAFSNEVFDPAMSQAMFRLSEEDRQRVLKESKGTNYSIVNPVKLEEVRFLLSCLRLSLRSFFAY
jgi:L-ornithine N5-oxygenase